MNAQLLDSVKKIPQKVRNKPNYWNNKQNVQNFLLDIKHKCNLRTKEDWDAITHKQIQSLGGRSLLHNHSIVEIKCMGFPEGELYFKEQTKSKPSGYWNNKENILQFLEEIRKKYNLKTAEDWNLIKRNQIIVNGGISLVCKYSMYEIKCMGFPEGISLFNKSIQLETNEKLSKFWENKENILQFLDKLKEKYNLKTTDDWNSITKKQIQSIEKGRVSTSLLKKYSLFELKCFGFPDGILYFDKPSGYWNNKENILQFLEEIRKKNNFKTAEDWNLMNHKHIQSLGGRYLLQKYSIYDLKCLGFPDGKLVFDKYKSSGYWKNKENVLQFLKTIQEKYNLQTINDWNSITHKHIQLNGGGTLLTKFSMYELKCFGFPSGKLFFDKPPGYWINKQNVLLFLNEIKEKYNLNTPKDWDVINQKHFQNNGGNTLLQQYSLYDLKCLGCPEGKSIFEKPISYKCSEFWNDKQNRQQFIDKLKLKYNLKTPEDWKRLSEFQIKSQGGYWLFYNNMKFMKEINITFKIKDKLNVESHVSYSLKDLLVSNALSKRSSQRWLFLQVQKLFPGEEIVEDYFHSDISRETGCSVQFDIFLIKRNIAIEYHGIQHYEDIPSGFSPLEIHQFRDSEKEELCSKYGIQLIVIPYWWNNKIDTLRATLSSVLNFK